MKRTLAIILAIILAMSLVGCGSPSDEEIKEPSNVVTGNNTEEGQQEEQVEEPEETEATISETVLVDEAGIKITAKSLEVDEFLAQKSNCLLRIILAKT